MLQAAGPCKNGGDRIGWGWSTFLPNSVVPCNSSMSSFGFHYIVRVNANWSHETERAKALSNNVRLHVTVIVFASPNETSIALDDLGDKIVDKTVLVPESLLFELIHVVWFVNTLKSVYKKTVILLQNCILSRQAEWISTGKSVLEASACKAFNRVVGVEHSQVTALIFLEVKNLLRSRCTAISWRKLNLNLAWFGCESVLASVLVAKSVATYNNRLYPPRH